MQHSRRSLAEAGMYLAHFESRSDLRACCLPISPRSTTRRPLFLVAILSRSAIRCTSPPHSSESFSPFLRTSLTTGSEYIEFTPVTRVARSSILRGSKSPATKDVTADLASQCESACSRWPNEHSSTSRGNQCHARPPMPGEKRLLDSFAAWPFGPHSNSPHVPPFRQYRAKETH